MFVLVLYALFGIALQLRSSEVVDTEVLTSPISHYIIILRKTFSLFK